MFKKSLCALFLCVPVLSMANCNLNLSTINLGIYNPLSKVDSQSSGSIQVMCEPKTSVSVKISGGSNPDINNRRMTGAKTDTLAYNLYVDSSRFSVFGNGINSSYYSGDSGNIPVFTKIPARQIVSSGFYSDNLLIELSF